MRELKLTLDFACGNCEQPVSVTVQYREQGFAFFLPGGEEEAASVIVPCPTCGQINRLTFEPNGQVRSVQPVRCFRLCPEPSIN